MSKPSKQPAPHPRRLDKFLADAGAGTRRAIVKALEGGCVAIDGVVTARASALVFPSRDRVTLDGVPLTPKDRRLYLMYHKPSGVLTALGDPHGRPTVQRDLPEGARPVGRLDKLTTGALIATDDGDLNFMLTHPNHHVDKSYVLTLEVGRARGPLPDAARLEMAIDPCDRRLVRMREGVDLDGLVTRPAKVTPMGEPRLESGRVLQCVEMVLAEGRYRQIRKMSRIVGLRLTHLHRARIGPIALGSVPVGRHRDLTPAEVDALYDAAGGRDAPRRRALEALADKLRGDALGLDEADRLATWLRANRDGAKI